MTILFSLPIDFMQFYIFSLIKGKAGSYTMQVYALVSFQ